MGQLARVRTMYKTIREYLYLKTLIIIPGVRTMIMVGVAGYDRG